MPSHKSSNPISKGGGGVTFERDVGALYLAALISDYLPPAVSSGKVKLVQFQARSSGALLDDVVVTVQDEGKLQRVCIFVRRKISASNSDPEFANFMKDCWEMFSGKTKFGFNPDTDRLVLAILSPPPAWLGNFIEVLKMTKQAHGAALFKTNVENPAAFGKKKQELLGEITAALTAAKGNQITDDELWRFLKCFAADHFDVADGGKDRNFCVSNLSRIAEGHDQHKAIRIFEVLSSKVGESAPSAGGYTEDMLLAGLKGLIDSKAQSGGGEALSADTEKILNGAVYIPMSTSRVAKSSTYSVSIVTSDGQPIDSLKYFKHALRFLEPRGNIYRPLREARRLAAQFNSSSAETVKVLEKCIISRMEKLVPQLSPSDNYHTTLPNSYSLPSLVYLAWDCLERGESSEIKTTAPAGIGEFETDGHWFLSQPVSGPYASANNLVQCDPSIHPSKDAIIAIILEVGAEASKVSNFKKIEKIMCGLEVQVKAFASNITELTEAIDLGIAERPVIPSPRSTRRRSRKAQAKAPDDKQFDSQLEGLA